MTCKVYYFCPLYFITNCFQTFQLLKQIFELNFPVASGVIFECLLWLLAANDIFSQDCLSVVDHYRAVSCYRPDALRFRCSLVNPDVITDPTEVIALHYQHPRNVVEGVAGAWCMYVCRRQTIFRSEIYGFFRYTMIRSTRQNGSATSRLNNYSGLYK